MARERSRVVKIKNIKNQNLLYGCFKKQSTVVLQSGYQRQGGKEKDRKRDGLGEREREKDITWGTELYRGQKFIGEGGQKWASTFVITI